MAVTPRPGKWSDQRSLGSGTSTCVSRWSFNETSTLVFIFYFRKSFCSQFYLLISVFILTPFCHKVPDLPITTFYSVRGCRYFTSSSKSLRNNEQIYSYRYYRSHGIPFGCSDVVRGPHSYLQRPNSSERYRLPRFKGNPSSRSGIISPGRGRVLGSICPPVSMSRGPIQEPKCSHALSMAQFQAPFQQYYVQDNKSK